jgi:hypothetical protein
MRQSLQRRKYLAFSCNDDLTFDFPNQMILFGDANLYKLRLRIGKRRTQQFRSSKIRKKFQECDSNYLIKIDGESVVSNDFLPFLPICMWD